MAAGVNRAICLDTVDDVVAKMDSVAIAHVLPARCANRANECQATDGMRSREARAQRGLDFVADHTKHRRYAGDMTGIWISSEKALDLFRLISAPYLFSDAHRFFTALPFFRSEEHTSELQSLRH